MCAGLEKDAVPIGIRVWRGGWWDEHWDGEEQVGGCKWVIGLYEIMGGECDV